MSADVGTGAAVGAGAAAAAGTAAAGTDSAGASTDSAGAAAIPTIAIVMPAYNEADRIELTFEAIASYVDRSGGHLPIFLADDGSTDRTTGVAWEAGERLGLELTILRLPHRGKALTVRDAMIAASGQATSDLLMMLDADNEISVDQLERVDWATDPRTVYIARRVAEVQGAASARPTAFRRLMSWSMRLAARTLLGLPFTDTQCGFKLFPRSLAFELFSQQRSAEWVFDAEILVIARLARLPIREVPVIWQPRGASRVRSTAAVSSAIGLLGIAARRWTGRYRRVGPPRR
jgi:glycosyltransferase involved in cell wall biosynthesis